jgi:hypothetical protein
MAYQALIVGLLSQWNRSSTARGYIFFKQVTKTLLSLRIRDHTLKVPGITDL